MTILAAPSPNAREWACRRTLFHGGLVRWGVPTYISVLPVLLHASLFSFAVGLVLFLWPLDAAVAYVVLSLTAFLLAAYLAYALFPLWYDDCPTQTVTQVQDLRRLGSFIAMPFRYIIGILVDLPAVLRLRLSAWRQGIIIRKNGMTSRIRNLCHRFQEMATYGLRHRAGSEPPLADASPSRRLDWEALKWLMIYSASDDVHGVTVQAMGSYICEQPGWRPSLKLRSGAQVLDRQLIQGINDCLYDRMTRLSSQKLGSEAAAIEYGRYARACLAMYKTDVWRMDWRVRRALSVFRAAKVPHILDLPVLHTLALLLHAEGDRSGPSMDSLLLSMQAQISQSMALDRDTASSHFAALQALQLMRRIYLSGAAGSPSSMAILCHAARLERLSYGDMWPVALYVTTTLGSTALQPPSKSDTNSARTRTILIELWSCILASGKLSDREATIAHEHLADSAHMLLREVGFRTMLDRFPHFVNLLDSPAFLQHRWKADGAAGRGAVWSAGAGARWSFDRIGPVADLALSIMRTTDAVPRECIPRLCARILRVASLSADAAPSDDIEAAQSVRDIMMRRLRDVVFGYRLLETYQSHPADMSRGRVADTEETLLSFLVSDEPTDADASSNSEGQGRSAWTCLLQVRGDHLVGIISVADVLAAELCRAQRRGAVTTDLTTTFFDGLTPLLFNVWRIWQSRDLISPAEVMQGRREIMRRIAQHCLELRPSWRTEECAAYFKECDDASAQYLYALFEEVDVTVSRCSICA
ncbi:hypothetical protein EXIGLDRAFT_801590 [Exidia glandulosa HHB12029]|uniref:DUF6535 domain-containing protein n=1 Tax=Exidia glandulosa HHB12029 TaxID=1314781 RepID=A0A165EFS5_EXIGL|nr:hypothetical protein EXIGLDRAFT_801590 [Exidia glandulosa HHB12029]